jgi:hypothetical protein
MEDFIAQIVAAVGEHKWAEACVVIAIASAAALNVKAEWFPWWSTNLRWRIVGATAMTIVAVVGDQLLNSATPFVSLPVIVPWVVSSVGVLLAEIRYANKGEVPPADLVIPEAPKRVSGRKAARKAGSK